ncbi:hypothetical protein N7I30_03485 [Aurantimonas litoralis]|nr:hypothetical protein [Aurantimonas litoralis]
MPRVSKIVEYRRARWLQAGMNLEQLAREAWGQFATHRERTISQPQRRAISGLRSHDFEGMGFAVHCGRYVDGQAVGTIPMTPAPDADLGEQPPGVDQNFLNSDFMAIIKDNHVIALNCGRNGAALRLYFALLFEQAGFDEATRQFELIRIASPNRIAMIERVGVKKVDLNIGIAEATAVALLDDDGDGVWNTFKRGVSGVISAMTAHDADLTQLRTAQQGTVSVSIDVGKGDLLAAREGLNHLAEDIAEDEEADSFVIYLRDGKTTIRPDEVAVRKAIRLNEVANSVSVSEAWDKMVEYLGELFENGQVEA